MQTMLKLAKIEEVKRVWVWNLITGLIECLVFYQTSITMSKSQTSNNLYTLNYTTPKVMVLLQDARQKKITAQLQLIMSVHYAKCVGQKETDPNKVMQ